MLRGINLHTYIMENREVERERERERERKESLLGKRRIRILLVVSSLN
jgi:hypothetical protein